MSSKSTPTTLRASCDIIMARGKLSQVDIAEVLEISTEHLSRLLTKEDRGEPVPGKYIPRLQYHYKEILEEVVLGEPVEVLIGELKETVIYLNATIKVMWNYIEFKQPAASGSAKRKKDQPPIDVQALMKEEIEQVALRELRELRR